MSVVEQRNYPQDPGGQFKSDVHRRVLGHLTPHTDDYGWTVGSLHERMRPDVGTNLANVDEVQAVLDELVNDGLAQRHDVGGGLYQMTEEGFDLLTGPIANEPPPGAALGQVPTPAVVGAAPALNLSGAPGPAGIPQGEEQPNADAQTVGPGDVQTVSAADIAGGQA